MEVLRQTDLHTKFAIMKPNLIPALCVICLTVFFSIMTYAVQAQDTPEPIVYTQKTKETVPPRESKGFIGVGLGFDYGGMGLKAEYLPIPYLGVFAAAGYNFVDLGYGFGITARLPVSPTVSLVGLGMYGYNGVVLEKGRSGKVERRTSYSGFSAGGGLEIGISKTSENNFRLKIMAPVRCDEFKEHIEATEAKGLPVALSLGINIAL